MGLERFPHDALVLAQHLTGLGIAQPLSQRRRPLHVREEDGDESTKRRPLDVSFDPQEATDLRHDDAGLCPGRVTHPFERNEPGVGKPSG